MLTIAVERFEDWRAAARGLLRQGVPPHEVVWGSDAAGELLPWDQPAVEAAGGGSSPRVPPAFLDLAERAACHRAPERWERLYRLLWRLTHGEPELLHVATDADVHAARTMAAAVRRDAHKMKAFVRFRRVEEADGETFVAWHRPDHRIVRLVAPFFARRFGTLRWAILTPDDSACWNLRELSFGAGVARSAAPDGDELEGLWTTYYAAIFNPARANPRAMLRELPRRHWATLPEAAAIPDLLREAPRRTAAMVATTEGEAMSAAEFLPESRDVDALRAAAGACEGCPLHKDATQTVFGVGPKNARVMLVGEAPGDTEDRQGEPFIGPAGKLLDDALADAGIDRGTVYVTNAVKHFKFKLVDGGRRLHQKPGVRETKACKPWLEGEVAAIKPDLLVCLGATAAQSVIGPEFRITQRRGEIVKTEFAPVTTATYHPSAILRAPDEAARAALYDFLVNDLRAAVRELAPGRRTLVERSADG